MSLFRDFQRLQDEVDSMFSDFAFTAWPLATAAPHTHLLTGAEEKKEGGDRQVARRENAERSLSLWPRIPSLRMDVMEKPDSFLVKADIPHGLKKEDVKINLEDDVLTISGERKEEKVEEKDQFHRTERYFGSFTRSFALPDDVDKSKIAANFDAGVLSLTLPKATQPETKKTEIKIN